MATMAVATAVLIIAPVAEDTTPGGNPEASAIAFGANAGLALVSAGLLAWWARQPGRAWPAIVATGIAVVLAVATADAAAEFRHRGPDLEVATATMWAGVVAFTLAALLAAGALVTARGR